LRRVENAQLDETCEVTNSLHNGCNHHFARTLKHGRTLVFTAFSGFWSSFYPQILLQRRFSIDFTFCAATSDFWTLSETRKIRQMALYHLPNRSGDCPICRSGFVKPKSFAQVKRDVFERTDVQPRFSVCERIGFVSWCGANREINFGLDWKSSIRGGQFSNALRQTAGQQVHLICGRSDQLEQGGKVSMEYPNGIDF